MDFLKDFAWSQGKQVFRRVFLFHPFSQGESFCSGLPAEHLPLHISSQGSLSGEAWLREMLPRSAGDHWNIPATIEAQRLPGELLHFSFVSRRFPEMWAHGKRVVVSHWRVGWSTTTSMTLRVVPMIQLLPKDKQTCISCQASNGVIGCNGCMLRIESMNVDGTCWAKYFDKNLLFEFLSDPRLASFWLLIYYQWAKLNVKKISGHRSCPSYSSIELYMTNCNMRN